MDAPTGATAPHDGIGSSGRCSGASCVVNVIRNDLVARNPCRCSVMYSLGGDLMSDQVECATRLRERSPVDTSQVARRTMCCGFWEKTA